MKIKQALICLFILCSFTILPAFAAGDVEAGKKKFVMCIACHGPKGISATPTYPTIAGKSSDFVIQQLSAFRSGQRDSAIMKPMASGLSDTDIENLAAHISALPKP